MSDLMLGASSFMTELLFITKDIVWKNEVEAQANETTDSAYAAQEYMMAMRGELTFDNIFSFNHEVLLAAGLPEDLAINVMDSKNLIPVEVRDLVVRLQTKYIIDHYEELNNYYRTLNGLPDLEDTEYFYNTKYPELSDSITPIHKLGVSAIYTLEMYGYLDELYKANPSKKYLLHMGSKKISPYIARMSSRFSILYINTSEFTNINNAFRDCYNACKYSVVRSLYIGEMRKENPYYDNFMAMCILFMSIQQMFALYLDADLTRDFYDYESLKYVYDSYGVPFYASIPLDYHIKIVKNINRLISHKGSTKVFFELFDIFNYGTMDVFDFYILKLHKFEDGKPVFAYNPDGTLDKKAMYELKFSQVRLYDNPPLELSDSTNHLSYYDMTVNDKYWLTDSDLLDKLYDHEFNYMETKYIGVRTVFDLMSIVTETAYLFKLLVDRRDITGTLSVYFSTMNTTIDLYTLIIYIATLTCAKFGYEGELSGNPAYVSKVMGFNFKQNLDDILNRIETDENLKTDPKLYNLLYNMSINNIGDLNTVFSNIKILYRYLTDKKAAAKSLKEYHAYADLFNTLMVSEYLHDTFKKSNGQPALSFADLLGDLYPDLYIRYQNIGGEIDSELNTTIALFEQCLLSIKYMQLGVTLNSNAMLEHLFKLLEFFKSAKAELTGYQVGYTMTKRNDTMSKYILDTNKEYYRYPLVHSDIDMLYDWIKLISELLKLQDQIKWDVWMDLGKLVYIIRSAKLRLEAKIHLIQYNQIQKMVGKDIIDDFLKMSKHTWKVIDGIKFTPQLDMIMERIIYEGRDFLINDQIEELTDSIVKIHTENKIGNKDFLTNTMIFSDKNGYSLRKAITDILIFSLGLDYQKYVESMAVLGTLGLSVSRNNYEEKNTVTSFIIKNITDSMMYGLFKSKNDSNLGLCDELKLEYDKIV